MPIYAKASGTSFTPAPAGSHAAVCVDVVDLGQLKVSWGGKEKTQHKIRIVWQIDEDRDDGKPYQVSRRYTLSLHEKASLRRDLEAWRGKQFTEQELQGFDVEVLLGVPALLSLIHATRDGDTFANVNAIMRLPRGMTAPAPRDYVRVCDRQPTESGEMPPPNEFGGIDDDLPF